MTTPKTRSATLAAQALAHQFNYHKPPTEEVAARHEMVRATCRAAAESLTALCPAGIERDRAVEACRLAMFWANAGIACNPDAPTPPLPDSAAVPEP